jgi:hypothetical protein
MSPFVPMAVAAALLLAQLCRVPAQQSLTVPAQPTTPSASTVPAEIAPSEAGLGPDPTDLTEGEDAESLYELITSIVLDNLPEQREDTRHWGMTKSVWRGVLVRKIESKREKMVDRINRRIDKRRDKLRFSLADLGKRAWDEFRDLSGVD